VSELVLSNLTKRFGNVVAVDAINLRVDAGELLVMVGPSGCGKTTTLRLIAGLEHPNEGQIHIAGRPVDRLCPKDRNVAMVFQDTALYPHLDVFGNLSFGLRMRAVGRQEIQRRVAETAQRLGIDGLLARRPAELSGGQQQRVALGRALVRRPAVFLLDEPFSSLDAPLRDDMRRELALLQRDLGTTTVHVTHDQLEALQLGQRIVVLHDGRIQQIGSPTEIHDQPANRFVAGFIGSPQMNFFNARLLERNGQRWLDAADFAFPWPDGVPVPNDIDIRDEITLGIRPPHLRIGPRPVGENGPQWRAEILLVQKFGVEMRLELRSATHQFTVCVAPNRDYRSGELIDVWAAAPHWHLFNAQTGRRLAA